MADLTSEAFNLPKPPDIVIAKSENCGRSIHVEWNSPFTEFELQLDSTSDRRAQASFDQSRRSPHMHFFHGLKSNAVYEVRIRARNTYSFGLWAKIQIRTSAGNTAQIIFHYCILLLL